MIDPRKILARRVDSAQSQVVVARQLGISQQYLCDILKGRREVSEAVAHALGLQRVIVFMRKATK